MATTDGPRTEHAGSIDTVVVVSGIPASGKTTLARDIGERLGMAVVSNDVIMEALFDALGTGDLEWSRELGRAAHSVMYALAADVRPIVLESFFWAGVGEDDLVGLGRPLVQVWCDCPVEVALERYRRRALDADRHSGIGRATRTMRRSRPGPRASRSRSVSPDGSSGFRPGNRSTSMRCWSSSLTQ